MTTISATQLANVRVHGLGLTDDFLLNLSDRAQTAKVDGTTPASYDLPPKTSLEEAVLDAWDDARKAWAKYDLHHTDPWLGWVRPLLKSLDYSFPGGGATGGKYAVRYLSETGDVPLHYAAPVMQGGELKAADLDRVTLHGTLRASPHGLMQGYLNATPEHLWGLVTNGEVLRVLRDNAQVTRPAYAEFNIGEMMRTEDARAFRVLYLLLHRSRLKGAKGSILESWNTTATSEGVKARDSLRDGVQSAIEHLGSGFLNSNPDLRERVKMGTLTPTTLYRACLNMVYQLVFLFVTEDRDLLFACDDQGEYVPDAATRERAAHYLTRAMRIKAAGLTGTNTHTDAYAGWERLLGYVRVGFTPLGLPALGSHLFQPNDLTDLKLGNQAFYAALRALSEITVDNQLRPVNYAGLDSEELGSIYESLLELVPRVQPGPRFELATLAGNERKTTGSYYTPIGLINLLLDSALEPVIEDAIRDKLPADAIAALKTLKIIDPACGSGHFLIAAARRIGARLAELEEETSQPSPAAQRKATRTVIAHCIYGADINPMAIELAKVALWLESQDAGKPLAFLDHRLRVGNSLLGTTPKLMYRRTKENNRYLVIPDDAFNPLEGDDRKYASAVKKRNKVERGQPTLSTQTKQLEAIRADFEELGSMPDDSLEQTKAKEKRFLALLEDTRTQNRHFVADAWCAAFVWPKYPGAPLPLTSDVLNALAINPDDKEHRGVAAEVRRLAAQYKFLQPHVEFPDVFSDDDLENDRDGFDCVLGNPPWERIKLQEKEWFAQRVPEVAEARNAAARAKLINALKTERPHIYADFQRDLRQAEGESHFIRASDRYPLTGRGDVNTYAIFSEANRDSLNRQGRMGIIVPTGIATDDTTKFFFQSLMDKKSLASLYDFENKKKIFVDVAPPQKFCVLTITGNDIRNAVAEFSFFAWDIEEARDPSKIFILSPADIALLNPNTRTAPVFRSSRDAAITKAIYQRMPVLLNEATGENPWGIRFMTMFHMSNDSGLFRTAAQLEAEGWTLDGNRYSRESEEMFPLYEPKLFHQFDHRYNTYEGVPLESLFNVKAFALPMGDLKIDTGLYPKMRYWVDSKKVIEKTKSAYLLSFRDVTNVTTNRRTGIFSIIPAFGTNHKAPIIFTEQRIWILYSNLNSFIFDFTVRQMLGGTSLSYFILKQLPILLPSAFTPPRLAFITPRVLELTYTAYDLTGFARDLNYPGDPFTWNDERRFWLRAELDALYFILYGIERNDADYIMDTFPIVRRKDIAAHGTYRTKDAILAIYDELQTLGLERLGEYQSKMLTLGLTGGDVAGGWRT